MIEITTETNLNRSKYPHRPKHLPKSFGSWLYWITSNSGKAIPMPEVFQYGELGDIANGLALSYVKFINESSKSPSAYQTPESLINIFRPNVFPVDHFKRVSAIYLLKAIHEADSKLYLQALDKEDLQREGV